MKARHFLLFCSIAATFLYTKLFLLPNVALRIASDAEVSLANAIRILGGERIYVDFFHFLPPGAEYVYVAFLKAFGTAAWVPNFVSVCVGMAFVWALFLVGRLVLCPRDAFLSGLLLLVVSYVSPPPGHHAFSTLFVLIGMAAVMGERTSRRSVIAAVMFGVASWFTPPRGFLALAGLITTRVWELPARDRTACNVMRIMLRLGSAYGAILLLLYFPFISAAGVERFFDDNVVFLLTHYNASSENNWSVLAETISPSGGFAAVAVGYFHIFLFPVVVLGAIFASRRRSMLPEEWRRIRFLTIMAVSVLVSIGNAPSTTRLALVSPPALILLIWIISANLVICRFARAALWLSTCLFLVVSPVKVQLLGAREILLPAGNVAIVDTVEYAKFDWLAAHTKPGMYLFSAGGPIDGPPYHYFLKLQTPGPIMFVTPDAYTKTSQVRDVIDALERHKTPMVVWPRWFDAETGASNPLPPLAAYLRRHYRKTKVFADGDQIWERN